MFLILNYINSRAIHYNGAIGLWKYSCIIVKYATRMTEVHIVGCLYNFIHVLHSESSISLAINLTAYPIHGHLDNNHLNKFFLNLRYYPNSQIRHLTTSFITSLV
jgi:hypothetical protein